MVLYTFLKAGKEIGRQIDQTSHVLLKMVYQCFRYLVTNFSDKTRNTTQIISQWEETYKYRIWDEASQAWLQYCEAVFSKPESSFYLLSNNVRVYELYCAKIENRLVWEALELRLITWEDSYCPFISHSPSQDCQGECKPDQFMSLKGDYCKASPLSSKTRENGRATCMCYQISVLPIWSNDKSSFCPVACCFNLLPALLTSVQREGRRGSILLFWSQWSTDLVADYSHSFCVPSAGNSS